ncbi:MAG: complex I NDUFA9 subunit family protein [Pseudomonadota bacterium]
MAEIATLYGGSGFVGSYIARSLSARGWTVRVAVRDERKARKINLGDTSEIVRCNILNDAEVAAAMEGAVAVVNCVGTFDARGDNNFDAIQNEGAGRIAKTAAEQGVARMVHLSAIGADAQGESRYARSKAAGEAAVQGVMPEAVILRPSVIFGPEDQFFNRFSAMSQISPAIPLFGAETKFQPVYVDDVAEAAEKAVLGELAGGIYELGGPDVATFRELMELMLDVVGRKRFVIGNPLWLGRLAGQAFDTLNAVTKGLAPSPITGDQALQLSHDNVVNVDSKSFAEIGITPKDMRSILPTYL